MTDHLQEILDRSLQEKGETHFPLVAMFFSFVITLKPKKILELGVRHGGSTYPFLCASKIVGAKLTSIDIENPVFECPSDLIENWTFIQSDAIKFLETAQNDYDLIYIDDWHSYAHVKRELELVDKISNQNTVILLHDLMAGHDPNYSQPMSDSGEWAGGGPFRAVNELDKNIWEWATIPINHGLTLLKKKPNIIIN